MAISKGKSSITLEELIEKVSETDILNYYLGINEIPCIINSPLREDNKPSFGLYYSRTKQGRIYFLDFATRESGGIFDLLGKLWNCNFLEVLAKISKDMLYSKGSPHYFSYSKPSLPKHKKSKYKSNGVELQCKVREWREYDLKYWQSFGISIEWLKYAEVYPISHIIISKNTGKYTIAADKYAYTYIEHKEEKVTLKIYQPFNNKGYKWCNKHDNSVISLWTKVPYKGDKLCICSSLKDALCLWANTGIPAIAIQGEGYSLSETAISELKKRYMKIYICLDNDEPGLKNAIRLAVETQFTNVVLPLFDGGKDISDFYLHRGKREFQDTMKSLFFNN